MAAAETARGRHSLLSTGVDTVLHQKEGRSSQSWGELPQVSLSDSAHEASLLVHPRANQPHRQVPKSQCTVVGNNMSFARSFQPGRELGRATAACAQMVLLVTRSLTPHGSLNRAV